MFLSELEPENQVETLSGTENLEISDKPQFEPELSLNSSKYFQFTKCRHASDSDLNNAINSRMIIQVGSLDFDVPYDIIWTGDDQILGQDD